jgi:CubicO group peptidase (beta-lactamase class C family)
MKRRQFMSLLGGAALAPIAATPVLAASQANCAIPARREDGWSISSASDYNGISQAALCGMADRLEGSGANIHAVLVARHGRLAFERYFKGSDEVPSRFFGVRVRDVSFDADTLHNLKSCSKSVASLVLGIAIDRGLIRSIDQPVFDFFPELSDLRSPEKDRILLSHLLTMSMGLKWVEATPATEDDNDEARMHAAQDACRYVLGLAVTAPAGQGFFYNTGALALLSAIVRKAAGGPLDEFARKVLFDPLGITDFEWSRFKGDSDAGGGLRLRPRDMAKIGQLVLAGGRWNDRQIVSKAWIEASTTAKLKADDYQSYGYLWWLRNTRLNGRVVQSIAALGRGGQRIWIVPELDLVVAVTAGYYQDYSPEAFKLQFGVFRDVLQAIAPPV